MRISWETGSYIFVENVHPAFDSGGKLLWGEREIESQEFIWKLSSRALSGFSDVLRLLTKQSGEKMNLRTPSFRM
jgi:hypothetical protein